MAALAGALRLSVPPSPPSQPPPLDRLLDRLRGRLRRAGSAGSSPGAAPVQDPLLAASRILRESREARGLGLRELARETRISTTVLEALERGWRDRLPEGAYLRTMLPLLEHYLELPEGSLDGALPPGRERSIGPRGSTGLRLIPPWLIDGLGTWQGSVLYVLLTLLLLHLLNLQQQRLAAAGLRSTRPVPPLPASAPQNEPRERQVLRVLPELRPLERAAAGQALAHLRREGDSRQRPDLSLGTLELTLKQPSQVRLVGAGDGATALSGIKGTLSLPVLPPFQLTIEPDQPGDQTRVLWRGAPLAAGPDGSWRYPPTAAAARPNRAAIAP